MEAFNDKLLSVHHVYSVDVEFVQSGLKKVQGQAFGNDVWKDQLLG
jgi:hypothetical protein